MANFTTTGSDTFPAGHVIGIHENRQSGGGVYTNSTTPVESGLTVTLTPASSSSIFWCQVHHIWHFNTASNARSTIRLFRDGSETDCFTSGILVSDYTTMDHWYQTSSQTDSGIDRPATTSEIVYTIQYYATSGQGTAYFHVGDHFGTNVTNEPNIFTVMEFSGISA